MKPQFVAVVAHILTTIRSRRYNQSFPFSFQTYKEKDAGKVVVYTTTMGILRETYQACMKVKQILRTLLVKYEERDVFMSSEYQAEIRDRMRCDYILVPQVFVDGQHVGVSTKNQWRVKGENVDKELKCR